MRCPPSSAAQVSSSPMVGQGQLQQLSRGGVAGVCVALGQESRQSGIGTNAWLPVLLKQLGHLYLLQLLKVAGTDGSQELVT